MEKGGCALDEDKMKIRKPKILGMEGKEVFPPWAATERQGQLRSHEFESKRGKEAEGRHQLFRTRMYVASCLTHVI